MKTMLATLGFLIITCTIWVVGLFAKLMFSLDYDWTIWHGVVGTILYVIIQVIRKWKD